MEGGPGRNQIRDWGPPFDPLAHAPNVNLEASLEERDTGGLGIYLMRQVMDVLLYQREDDANILIMIKRFSSNEVSVASVSSISRRSAAIL